MHLAAPRPRASLRFALPILASLAVLLTRATPASAAEEPPDDGLHARGYLGIDVGLAAPSGPFAPHLPSVDPALQVSFGVGLRGIPLTLGVGLGVIGTGSRTDSGPTVITSDGFSLGATTTDVRRSATLRHAELVLRLEPEWETIRPFAEAQFGVVGMWHDTQVTGSDGEVIQDDDHQASAAAAYGFTLGVAYEPWHWRSPPPPAWDPAPVPQRRAGVAFVAGVRYWKTGPLEDAQIGLDPSTQQVVVDTYRGSLTSWMPFVGVQLVVD